MNWPIRKAGQPISEQREHGCDDGVRQASQARTSPVLAASVVYLQHIERGNVSQGIDDAVAGAAALARITQEFQHDRREHVRGALMYLVDRETL